MACSLLMQAATMKQTKFLISAAGVIGLLAVFAFPYISAEGFSFKYWDLHKFPADSTVGLLNGPKQVYIALGCFIVPVLAGLVAIATKQLQRWQAVIAGVFSLAAFACEGVRKGLTGDHDVSTAIGGKLLFLAAAAGLVFAIMGAVKPEPAPRV